MIRLPKHRHLAAAALLGGLALLLILLAATGRARITTDILALLPEDRRDVAAAAAMTQSRNAFFNDVTIVLSGPGSARADIENALAQLQEYLRSAPLSLSPPGARMAALQDIYKQNPFEWLTPQDRAALGADAVETMRLGLGVNLARPGNFDPADPAGFVSAFVTQLPAPNDDWTFLGDVPARVANNEIRALINARLTESPLDPAVQQQLSDLLASSERAVQRACEQCALHWTGAIRYSEATRKAAERDIKLLSTMASLGILLLFTLTFRAIRPLLVTAGTILSAILAGLATSFAVFGTVHVLTLVFGTTLLGLCVDYLLHFMVHRWAHADDSGAAALRAVAPGLLLGLASSVTAFLFLLFAGFPALSQLAVFSIAGLLTAWLLVHLCLPELLTPGTANNVVARLAITRVALSTKARLVLLAAIGMIALTGIPQLRIVDDVRGLQAVPDALSDDNHFVRTTLEGMPGDTGNADFVLVEAPDLDTALEREMQLLNSMEGPDGFGLSRFLLPQGAREANLRAYAALFENDGRQLRLILSAFGFRPALADDLVARYTTSTADVTPSATLLAQPAFDAQRTLLVTVENGVALMTRIPGDVRIPEQMPWARFIRPLEKIESTFSSIRQRGTIAVAAAWLLMLSILSFRYGPVGGVRVLAPALFGACVAVGFLGLAGWPLNIFSLVALILVLGIGADYALFLREGAAHIGTARLATTLAAATSLLSFGLLAFSSLPALRAFGFAISIGILTAFLAAPLALPLMAERKRASQRMDELDEAA